MILLGSSGSIGRNTLKIAKKLNLEVEILGVGRSIELLNEQILAFNPKSIIIASKEDKKKVLKEFKGKIYYGELGILEAIEDSQSKLVINALVGFLGLHPTLHAIKCGKTVALANKESLVVGGKFIDISKIIPIDSEHFALCYLMNFNSAIRPFRKLYITASGGALRDIPLSELEKQDSKSALQHPNWKMGGKITIDSSTMANKLFEILEGFWLFGSKNIDAFIERNSHIHALVEFWDGSTIAHFATADMQLPIAYALCMGLGLQESFLEKFTGKAIVSPLDLKSEQYAFEIIDSKRYPLWDFKDMLLENPSLGIVFNAANEVVVESFLQNKVYFGEIVRVVAQTLKAFESVKYSNVEDLFRINQEARDFAKILLN